MTTASIALDRTLADIHTRWGDRAIRRLSDQDPAGLASILSTGLADLDNALGIGGIPRGRITELLGTGSAGQGSLAASLAAQAQKRGDQVVYVDAAHQADLSLLTHWGVELKNLCMLRPLHKATALEMTRDLFVEGNVDLILFDRFEPTDPSFESIDQMLSEVTPLLGRSSSTLVFLTRAEDASYPPGRALPYFSSVRLSCEHVGWIHGSATIEGVVARVTVVKNKLGPPRRMAELSLRMPTYA
jgi:recombination protein RecA